MSNQWMFSHDEEDFTSSYDFFDTREEAIKAGKEHFQNEVFFVGRVYHPTYTLDADDVIEGLQNTAYNDSDEWGGSWLDHLSMDQKKTLENRLNKVLLEWLEETNNEPHWYLVDSIDRKVDDNQLYPADPAFAQEAWKTLLFMVNGDGKMFKP